MDVNPNTNEELVQNNEAANEVSPAGVEGNKARDAEGKEEVNGGYRAEPLVDPIAI